jgi:hypothetical protein
MPVFPTVFFEVVEEQEALQARPGFARRVRVHGQRAVVGRHDAQPAGVDAAREVLLHEDGLVRRGGGDLGVARYKLTHLKAKF